MRGWQIFPVRFTVDAKIMLRRETCLKIVTISLLAVAVQHITRIVIHLDVFAHYYKHHPGPCKKLENIQPGSEDFYTLPNGLTFISSGFRLQKMSSAVDEHFRKHKVKGRIYLFDLRKVEEGVKELKIPSTDQFNNDTFYPHGISVWEDEKAGRHIVFVVNHPLEEPVADRIEKFIYNPEKQELIHQAYYSGETMKTVNDVQPTGENSFYFTNYQYFRHHIAVLTETILELPLTDVVYFDSVKYMPVADKLLSPNGIAMSSDGQVSSVMAVSSTEFYLTNMFTKHSRGMMLLELLALMPWSNVMFCEHSLCQEVAGGLLGACGIVSSTKEGSQFVYVAACLGREVRVFKRNSNNSLSLKQIYPLNSVPDNIQVDHTTGDLYIGSHPIAYKILQHLEDPDKNPAPSQVLQLHIKDGNITSAQELLYDQGDLISASTSAIVFGQKLLIGSIFHNLVICDVNVPL